MSAGSSSTAGAGSTADLAAESITHTDRIAVGLGCDRGVALETVQLALEQALALVECETRQVAVLASIDAKADEVAFLQLARALDRPLRCFPADALAGVAVPNPSATVLRYMGTPSVSEAAALLAAGAADARALLVEKLKLRGPDGRHATVSLARMAPGTGPSHQEHP